jgi:hypothetical protein
MSHKIAVRIFGGLSTVLVLLTIVWALWEPIVLAERTKGLIVGIWVLVPPLWFWIEYHFLYRKLEGADFERFKYGQELSRNLWVAIAAVLLYLYLGSFPGES